MAYSPLPTKSASDTITLTNWDNIRDDFIAGVPDIYTTKGDLGPATGADVAARLGVGADDSILVADSASNVGMSWQLIPAARVFNASAIDPATSTWVSLTFDSERYDTDAVHTPTGSTQRLTVPTNGAGLYLVGGNVEFAALDANTGTYGTRILLNGTTVIAEDFMEHAGNNVVNQNVHTVYSLAATDYVELQAFTSKDLNVNATANFSPEFWIQWLRRQ